MSSEALFSQGYDLLARLIERPPTPELLEEVRETSLAADLPPDPERLAEEHYALFLQEIPPAAGVFLDPEGLLEGPSASSARAFYRSVGFPGALSGVSADHLSWTLACLSFLSGALADAIQDDQPAEEARIRPLVRRALDRHLLSWMPPWIAAVEDQGSGFYPAVAGLALELATEQRRSLGSPGAPPDLPDPASLIEALPEGPRPLARYLLSPWASGVYLSRSDLGELAGDLPRGFGGRELMGVNLLESAARFEEAASLGGRLLGILERRERRYRELAGRPVLAPYGAAWAARVGESRKIIQDLFG